MTQILLKNDPPLTSTEFSWEDPVWNANWIESPSWDGKSDHVCVFRRVFELGNDSIVRIHITADQRYVFYVDGKRVGFGPDRGDHYNWFYQTHDLSLSKGSHTIVAMVWWLSRDNNTMHWGHLGYRPSFLLNADGEFNALLATGSSDWEVMEIHGITFTPASFNRQFCLVGGRTNITASEFPVGFERGDDSAGTWVKAKKGPAGFLREHLMETYPSYRQLKCSMIPAMYEGVISAGKVRHAQILDNAETGESLKFFEKDNNADVANAFQKMLDGGGKFTLPVGVSARILIDADNYVCAWPVVSLGGGKNSRLEIAWAETLYLDTKMYNKGNRDEIEGKFFFGLSDSFVMDGSEERVFEPLWWEAGRYILVTIEAPEQDLDINSFKLRETHYPLDFKSSFECDDDRWESLFAIFKRSLQMCSHEVFFDCPYYEQLMYAGDTRLEILATYTAAADDKLARKAILLFDESRDQSGLTLSRTPTATRQVIPPFSLWWSMMVYDYAFWRDDLNFVRARMPGVRSVLDTFIHSISEEDGLVHTPDGWAFTDWVDAWNPGGTPPGAQRGVNATINLHFILVLRHIAQLEEFFGEKEMATRYRRIAGEVNNAVVGHYWVSEKSLFAEDKEKTLFSEHAQCMALLGDSSPDPDANLKALLETPGLERTTIYFSYYLLETFGKNNLPDEIYKRLDFWFGLRAKGLRTTVERGDPTRSDCHAWGVHPMFHAYATLAGIRPSEPGFKKVEIRPQPGPLKQIEASLIHPCGGYIELDLKVDSAGKYNGSVSVPDSIAADLVLPGCRKSWTGGKITF
jgi:alpha-L-rhamnosidase